MKREEYIICDRCEAEFDPSREMELGFSALRCPSCGQSHNATDAQLGDMVETAEENTDGLDDRQLDTGGNAQGVYVIASGGGPVKIGVSKQPYQRKADLQVGHPHSLELLTYNCECKAADFEKGLHKKYSEYRLNGEWFDIPESKIPQLVSLVKAGEMV